MTCILRSTWHEKQRKFGPVFIREVFHGWTFACQNTYIYIYGYIYIHMYMCIIWRDCNQDENLVRRRYHHVIIICFQFPKMAMMIRIFINERRFTFANQKKSFKKLPLKIRNGKIQFARPPVPSQPTASETTANSPKDGRAWKRSKVTSNKITNSPATKLDKKAVKNLRLRPVIWTDGWLLNIYIIHGFFRRNFPKNQLISPSMLHELRLKICLPRNG